MAPAAQDQERDQGNPQARQPANQEIGPQQGGDVGQGEGSAGHDAKAALDQQPADALVLGDYMLPGSSTDWWLNPETYGKPLDVRPEEVVVDGWIIEEGGERLEPDRVEG